MDLPGPQLAALVAVVDHGTFEAAARALHVTPSAVSQRSRALESAVGNVLVRRTTPCSATEAGATLVRLGRAQSLLQAEARVALHPDAERVDLGVAVNADSLATWFREVIAEIADWDDVALRLSVEDQGFSSDLLRRGEALAAVTSDPVAVQGCSVERLGTMRYRPAAAPRLPGSERVEWARMPVIVFNDKDRLQHDLLALEGAPPPVAVHRVPTSTDYLVALEAGLGWGMVPEAQLDPLVARGALRMLGERSIDVPLHWQRWRLDSPVLERLSDAVRDAARRHLR